MTLILLLILWFTVPEVPPGTKKVGTQFVDKTEILNIHWMEYLYHQKKELDSTSYKALLPDKGNNWYHQKEFRFQPIVLITYQQALDFCLWRSKMVSTRLQKKVTYRLPTPDEWNAMAKANLVDSADQVKKSLAQLKKLKPNALFFFDVEHPTDRFYHIFDNVSEMTQKEGVAMGPNNHELAMNTINSGPLLYKRPNPYLGFRCVAEIDE